MSVRLRRCQRRGVFGATDHYVYALNAVTGALIWKQDAGDQISQSSPAVFHGVVYIGVGVSSGSLIALDAVTGQHIWSYPFASPADSSPAIANGIVYLAPSQDSLYAIDAATGTLVWKTAAVGWGGSPTVANGVVYQGNPSLLYAFDAATGAMLWNSGVPGKGTYSTPTVVNGLMYIGTIDWPNNVKAYHLALR